MAHQRETIRRQVVATLTGLATTGANIQGHQVVVPWPKAKLPSLNVYTPSELNFSDDRDGGTRSMQLVVEGRADATAGILDLLDDIAAEVEAAMVGLGLKGTSYSGMETRIEGDQETPVGVVTITYEVVYTYKAGG